MEQTGKTPLGRLAPSLKDDSLTHLGFTGSSDLVDVRIAGPVQWMSWLTPSALDNRAARFPPYHNGRASKDAACHDLHAPKRQSSAGLHRATGL